MVERLQVYKCSVCGNVVEVLTAGGGDLVCCGQRMENLTVKTADQGKEKHVPVIEKIDGGIKVKIGSVQHPMEEKHYIEWIEVISDGKAYRQFLKPGQTPEAVFNIPAGNVRAREHCNLHGLWEAK
ncbi:MAG TPA: desulfoferrodoxin [Sedimentisphaerales bacterium]|nr:desulfoferrodoxin [Sedimentisphaerales bacterium]